MQAALLGKDADLAELYGPARRAVDAQLDISPFDSAAWVRLAMLEMKSGGGAMTPEAQDALMMSYERAPVDASISPWRIALVFDHWDQASLDLRQAAAAEVEVLYRPPQNRRRMNALAGEIENSEGVFAYRLLLAGIDRS